MRQCLNPPARSVWERSDRNRNHRPARQQILWQSGEPNRSRFTSLTVCLVCFVCSASVVVLVDELIEVLVELKVVVDRVVVVMVVEEMEVLRSPNFNGVKQHETCTNQL